MSDNTPQERLFSLLSAREIYIERQFRSGYAQIRAIDALTGIEVAVTTPANAAQHDQNRLVLRKLAQTLVVQGHLPNFDRDAPANSVSVREKGDNQSGVSPSLPKGGIFT